MSRKHILTSLAVLFSLGLLASCGNTWDGAKQDTKENVEATGEAIEKSGEAIKDTVN